MGVAPRAGAPSRAGALVQPWLRSQCVWGSLCTASVRACVRDSPWGRRQFRNIFRGLHVVTPRGLHIITPRAISPRYASMPACTHARTTRVGGQYACGCVGAFLMRLALVLRGARTDARGPARLVQLPPYKMRAAIECAAIVTSEMRGPSEVGCHLWPSPGVSGAAHGGGACGRVGQAGRTFADHGAAGQVPGDRHGAATWAGMRPRRRATHKTQSTMPAPQQAPHATPVARAPRGQHRVP